MYTDTHVHVHCVHVHACTCTCACMCMCMYMYIRHILNVWGAKCVKNDVKQPIYISLPHIYIKRDIYISGVIFIYIWPGFIYM